MATRGENCNDWPRTVMTGGCLLVAFVPDGATGNDDDDDVPIWYIKIAAGNQHSLCHENALFLLMNWYTYVSTAIS